MNDKPLQDIWDHVNQSSELQTLGDVTRIKRCELEDKSRPVGVCWVCEKFAEKSLLTDEPQYAECCKGCDAYKGGD